MEKTVPFLVVMSLKGLKVPCDLKLAGDNKYCSINCMVFAHMH